MHNCISYMKGLLKTRPSGFITPNLQLGNQLIRTTPLEIEFISLFYSLINISYKSWSFKLRFKNAQGNSAWERKNVICTTKSSSKSNHESGHEIQGDILYVHNLFMKKNPFKCNTCCRTQTPKISTCQFIKADYHLNVTFEMLLFQLNHQIATMYYLLIMESISNQKGA